jgi:hypothetical protein
MAAAGAGRRRRRGASPPARGIAAGAGHRRGRGSIKTVLLTDLFSATIARVHNPTCNVRGVWEVGADWPGGSRRGVWVGPGGPAKAGVICGAGKSG